MAEDEEKKAEEPEAGPSPELLAAAKAQPEAGFFFYEASSPKPRAHTPTGPHRFIEAYRTTSTN